jgi:hypothetical protein
MSIYGIMFEAKDTGKKETIPGLKFDKHSYTKSISFLLWDKHKRVKLYVDGSKDKAITVKQIRAYTFLTDEANQKKVSAKIIPLIIKWSKINKDQMNILKDKEAVIKDTILKSIVIDYNGTCALICESRSENKKGWDSGMGIKIYPSYSIGAQSEVL